MAEKFNYPTWNTLHFDRASRQPLHEQFFCQLRSAISSGQIPRGTRLPPSRKLAAELGVSRNTVVHVYDRLAAEGYVCHRIGAGTFVEATLPEDHQIRGATGTKQRRSRLSLSARGEFVAGIGMPWDRLAQFDLSAGVPALDQFPFEKFTALFGRYWLSRPSADLGYGEPGGLRRLRQQIALYLGEARGVACEPDQVVIVNGTLQAITLVSQLLLEPGDAAVVEDPGNVTEIATLMANGVRPISVPIDREGLDVAVAGTEARGARLAAVTPVGQFPYGSIMGLQRRQALLSWAYENDGWIFEDDFNSEIRWGGKPLPPLAAMDQKGHVIYASSFNRILCPGMRLGYLVVPPDLIDSFTAAQQALACHVSTPLQRVIADFMERGYLASHMRRMRILYQDRAATLAAQLRRQFGDIFEIPEVEAGLHLTATTQIDIDDVAVSNAALRFRLDVPALSRYCRSTRRLRGFIYGFGNTPASRIPRCVRNFARAFESSVG